MNGQGGCTERPQTKTNECDLLQTGIDEAEVVHLPEVTKGWEIDVQFDAGTDPTLMIRLFQACFSTQDISSVTNCARSNESRTTNRI